MTAKGYITGNSADGYTLRRRVELHNLESGGGASVMLNPLQARRSASSRLRR